MAIDGVTSCMKIREVNKNKKQFISLLLLADEQESMRSASITALKRAKTASAISPHGQRARS